MEFCATMDAVEAKAAEHANAAAMIQLMRAMALTRPKDRAQAEAPRGAWTA